MRASQILHPPRTDRHLLDCLTDSRSLPDWPTWLPGPNETEAGSVHNTSRLCLAVLGQPGWFLGTFTEFEQEPQRASPEGIFPRVLRLDRQGILNENVQMEFWKNRALVKMAWNLDGTRSCLAVNQEFRRICSTI